MMVCDELVFRMMICPISRKWSLGSSLLIVDADVEMSSEDVQVGVQNELQLDGLQKYNLEIQLVSPASSLVWPSMSAYFGGLFILPL